MASLENKIVGTQYKFPAYWFVAHLDEFGKYDNAHWIVYSSSFIWYETFSCHIVAYDVTITRSKIQNDIVYISLKIKFRILSWLSRVTLFYIMIDKYTISLAIKRIDRAF